MKTEFKHRIHVNVAGSAKHPVVMLWCSDCLRAVGDFDQINDLKDMLDEVAAHSRNPSRREQLRAEVPQ